MCFEDVESLLWYKHVVKTLFERPKEAFAWVTIAQDSVCCSRIFAKPVVMRFDQRQGSSDGEVILPKAAGCRLGLTEAVAECPGDRRARSSTKQGSFWRSVSWTFSVAIPMRMTRHARRKIRCRNAGGTPSGRGRGLGLAGDAAAIRE